MEKLGGKGAMENIKENQPKKRRGKKLIRVQTFLSVYIRPRLLVGSKRVF